METIGNRLKIARIRANLQQNEVIERLKRKGFDLTQTSLSRYENDKREIGLNLLRELSIIYNVDVRNIIWSDYELAQIKKGRDN